VVHPHKLWNGVQKTGLPSTLSVRLSVCTVFLSVCMCVRASPSLCAQVFLWPIRVEELGYDSTTQFWLMILVALAEIPVRSLELGACMRECVRACEVYVTPHLVELDANTCPDIAFESDVRSRINAP
jgi:hypothetical protein